MMCCHTSVVIAIKDLNSDSKLNVTKITIIKRSRTELRIGQSNDHWLA